MPAFELRHRDIVVNVTRLEHYHQKKRYHEANDAPFQSPENGVEHLRVDCNRGVFGFKRSECEIVAERGILAEKRLVICTVVLPIRLSLCRERLAWGVPQRATLLNAAAGRRKTRRVRNQNMQRSTARASNSSHPQNATRKSVYVSQLATFTAQFQKLFDGKCAVIKYKKFVSLSDL